MDSRPRLFNVKKSRQVRFKNPKQMFYSPTDKSKKSYVNQKLSFIVAFKFILLIFLNFQILFFPIFLSLKASSIVNFKSILKPQNKLNARFIIFYFIFYYLSVIIAYVFFKLIFILIYILTNTDFIVSYSNDFLI